MGKDWRTILRFAVLGLVIATAFLWYFETAPPPGSSQVLLASGASLFLCRGSFLFVLAFDIAPQTTDSASCGWSLGWSTLPFTQQLNGPTSGCGESETNRSRV